MNRLEVNGDFEGEIKVEPIRFKRIEKKHVIKNNSTSGKILTSPDWIGEDVILLFPKKKSRGKL